MADKDRSPKNNNLNNNIKSALKKTSKYSSDNLSSGEDTSYKVPIRAINRNADRALKKEAVRDYSKYSHDDLVREFDSCLNAIENAKSASQPKLAQIVQDEYKDMLVKIALIFNERIALGEITMEANNLELFKRWNLTRVKKFGNSVSDPLSLRDLSVQFREFAKEYDPLNYKLFKCCLDGDWSIDYRLKEDLNELKSYSNKNKNMGNKTRNKSPGNYR